MVSEHTTHLANIKVSLETMAQAMLTFSASLKLLTDRAVAMETKIDHLQLHSSSSHKRTVAESGYTETQNSPPKRRRSNSSSKGHSAESPTLLSDKNGELQRVASSSDTSHTIPEMVLPRSPAPADTSDCLSLRPEEPALEATPLHSNFFRLAEQFGPLSVPSRSSPPVSSVTGSTLVVPQVTPTSQPLDILYGKTPARNIPASNSYLDTTALHPSSAPIRPSTPTFTVSRSPPSIPKFSTPNPGVSRSGSPDIDERIVQSSPVSRIHREPWPQTSEPPRFCSSPNLDNPTLISNSPIPSLELSDNRNTPEAAEMNYASLSSLSDMKFSPAPASGISQGLGLQTQDFRTHS
ncbi:hypothetical protein IWQ62_003468 [Dispira parvispora]|uniref:Uncharacterized protein n=1 Tax=Dispira parvispora TaxID=1520584 RepID=A0A9W8ANN4_9FUNG|nr:hypothetical protein IWQ62_003468 [Dispira parvispora]